MSQATEQHKAEQHKERARAWFETLRDDICAAFEALEDELGEEIAETLPIAEALRGMPPGRFERKAWAREPGSGGGGPTGRPWPWGHGRAVGLKHWGITFQRIAIAVSPHRKSVRPIDAQHPEHSIHPVVDVQTIVLAQQNLNDCRHSRRRKRAPRFTEHLRIVCQR